VSGCSAGAEALTEPPYTVTTVQHGFIRPAEVADGMVQSKEPDEHSHAMFIPANAVPTCPYVDRSDTPREPVDMYFEPTGAQPTGKHLVQGQDYRDMSLPYISQGALIFATPDMAKTAMQQATGHHAKCPTAFDITGAPPEILGEYRVSSRPFTAQGWEGWKQHLVHTYPPEQGDDVYDDQVNVVVRKDNAILLFTYNQTMQIGQVAVGEKRIDDLLETALARLG
jgi:hypothetical protein